VEKDGRYFKNHSFIYASLKISGIDITQSLRVSPVASCFKSLNPLIPTPLSSILIYIYCKCISGRSLWPRPGVIPASRSTGLARLAGASGSLHHSVDSALPDKLSVFIP